MELVMNGVDDMTVIKIMGLQREGKTLSEIAFILNLDEKKMIDAYMDFVIKQK